MSCRRYIIRWLVTVILEQIQSPGDSTPTQLVCMMYVGLLVS